jgi:hypothetical protein
LAFAAPAGIGKPQKGKELSMKPNADISNLTKFIEELRAAAQQCPKCEGTRETTFTSRGRDNIVPCLECENVHQALEHLEKALKLLTAG